MSGCEDELPSRDLIPVIKNRIYLVQEAIKVKIKYGIDTLLTSDYAEENGADSLVQFAYGTDPTFEFDRFASTEIYFTNDKARVDCIITGKDNRVLKSATLTFERKKTRWLLKKIGPGLKSVDSIKADSVI
jgi:hypothetical protein